MLTDDLAAREAARSLGLTPVGSVGLVLRASATGLLNDVDAEALLLALQDSSSLFVTRAIIERAVQGWRSRQSEG